MCFVLFWNHLPWLNVWNKSRGRHLLWCLWPDSHTLSVSCIPHTVKTGWEISGIIHTKFHQTKAETTAGICNCFWPLQTHFQMFLGKYAGVPKQKDREGLPTGKDGLIAVDHDCHLMKPDLHPHCLSIAGTIPSHSCIALMFSHICHTLSKNILHGFHP